MARGNSRLMLGLGVVCFLGVSGLWLAFYGERASAEALPPPSIDRTVLQTATPATQLSGTTASKVIVAGEHSVVARLNLYVNIESSDPRTLKVYLTSPSGTRVQVADGAVSNAVRTDRLEGWFGDEGLAPAQSLTAFGGEPLAGAWVLTVESKARGRLMKWSLSVDAAPDTGETAMAAFGVHRSPSSSGCDCRLGGSPAAQEGLGLILILLGLAALRRRR